MEWHIHRRAVALNDGCLSLPTMITTFGLCWRRALGITCLRHHRVPDEFVNNLGDLKQMAEAYFEHFTSRHQGQAPRRRIERIGEKIVESIIPVTSTTQTCRSTQSP